MRSAGGGRRKKDERKNGLSPFELQMETDHVAAHWEHEDRSSVKPGIVVSWIVSSFLTFFSYWIFKSFKTFYFELIVDSHA